jgi:photosystem II stability/assembly factor-like uncharacterized protein
MIVEEVYTLPKGDFKDLCFVSEQVGFIVGPKSFAIRTEDGGKSWNQFPTDTFTNNEYSQVYFINDSIGLIKYWNYYAYTTDVGKSWITGKDTIPYTYLRKQFKKVYRGENLYYSDSLKGFEYNISDVRKYGKIRKTTNGGKSWVDIETGQNNQVKDLKFLSSGYGVGVGNYSYIVSYNFGDTWSYFRNQQGESVDDLLKVSVVNDKVQYAITKTKLYKITLNR